MMKLKKELKELTDAFRTLQEIEKTFPQEIKKLTDKYNQCKEEMSKYQAINEELERIKKEIIRILQKNRKNVEVLDGTLSCLSCLEYLKDPLTLVCGHSICKNCFNQHSDPSSKDSLVFCEECKIETKNKMLKEQLVMRTICQNYGGQREAIQNISDLVIVK